MQTVMEEEVRPRELGNATSNTKGAAAHRFGKDSSGYCVVDGRKVPIQKTRLRTKDKQEQRLGQLQELSFQRSGPLWRSGKCGTR